MRKHTLPIAPGFADAIGCIVFKQEGITLLYPRSEKTYEQAANMVHGLQSLRSAIDSNPYEQNKRKKAARWLPPDPKFFLGDAKTDVVLNIPEIPLDSLVSEIFLSRENAFQPPVITVHVLMGAALEHLASLEKAFTELNPELSFHYLEGRQEISPAELYHEEMKRAGDVPRKP